MLCHTDLWGANLLLSADDRLWVLDWDGAVLAPPECDLFMFAATSFFPARRFAAFLDRYGTPPGRTSPDADLLAFYAYRHNLEDLAMFVDSLTAHRTDVLESSDTLRFAASTVAELAQLKPWIAAAIEVLGGASEPEAPRDPRAPVLVDGIARNSDNITQDC